MSFSEDSATPAAPFSGDGSVFDQPDVLLAAPVTSERVVETQSGFLLVIKRMGERLALTCKRRVGTPPNSVILLTPDESIKFSRVLSASITGLPDSGKHPGSRVVAPGKRRIPFSAPMPRQASLLQKLSKPATAVLTVALLGCTVMLGLKVQQAMTDRPTTVQKILVSDDPFSSGNVDKFSRAFVQDMLDFSADTYRMSQVRAMSVMSPELMNKYWEETHFPVSRAQLKLLPQSTMVVIDRIDQQRDSKDSATADVFAQLVRSDAKLSNSVHIKLKLALGDKKNLQVVEQEDLTAETR